MRQPQEASNPRVSLMFSQFPPQWRQLLQRDHDAAQDEKDRAEVGHGFWPFSDGPARGMYYR